MPIHLPRSLAVAASGSMYIAESLCVREFRADHIGDHIRTIAEYDSLVRGLLLVDNLLYVTVDGLHGHDSGGVHTVYVGTNAEREEANLYPALQTWALVQKLVRNREQPSPVRPQEECEMFAHDVLVNLMLCAIPEILVRTLRFHPECYDLWARPYLPRPLGRRRSQ